MNLVSCYLEMSFKILRFIWVRVGFMRSYKPLLLVAALAIPVAGAHAITFSNFLINGVPPGAGNPTSFGPNGLSFSIADNFLVGVGAKTLTINYRVDATPGMLLDQFSIFPVGTSRKGSVGIDVTHVNGGSQTVNYLFSNATATTMSLTSQLNNNLSPKKAFYDVTTVIKLTGTAADSVNKLTIYNVSYTEAVPEPASMTALALGLGTIFARRARKKK